MKLKEALVPLLTPNELEAAPSSFDTVGDIAIFNEVDSVLKKKEKLIAETLLKLHNNIKVVLKKTARYSGKLRTPKLAYLAGGRRKITTHKENGVSLMLDVEKCYFSTRTATERQRIVSLVKKGESVLVMFSGVSPLGIEIAKHTKAKEVYGIELNKIAHHFALKNVTLNKVNNVVLVQGDVSKVLLRLKKKFDRIVMPLPKEAKRYLPLAVKSIKPKGSIHLYTFLEEKEISQKVKEYKATFSSVKAVRCGQYAPHVFRVCLDLRK